MNPRSTLCLCEMPTGWMSDREHLRWLRLARRIGVLT